MSDAAKSTYSVEELKMRANKLFKEGKFKGAEILYTAGLRMSENDVSLQETLLCNRAAARLKQHLFTDALEDVDEILLHNPYHKKGLFRRGEALMGLGLNKEALDCFLTLQTVGGEGVGQKIQLLQYQDQRDHSSCVLYDKPSTVQKISERAEIKISEGRGRGLYAIHNLGVNEVVFMEAAFASAFEDECLSMTAPGQAADISAITGAGVGIKSLQRVQLCRRSNERLATLYDGKHPNPFVADVAMFEDEWSSSAPTSSLIAAHPLPILRMEQILPIVVTNAFATNRARSDKTMEFGTGLWLVAAYINHSSAPNCTYETQGDAILIRADQPIGAGTELTINYVEAGRESSLKMNWGIESPGLLCS